MSESVQQSDSARSLEEVVIELDRKIHGEDYDTRKSQVLARALLESEEPFTKSDPEDLRR